MHKLTENQSTINRRNRKYAVKYFKRQGLWFPGCHLHHKDPSWREYDIWRYIAWRPEDLVVLSSSEHNTVHQTYPLKYYNPEEDKGFSIEDEPWWIEVFYQGQY